MDFIDLRSDTVSWPTPEMREAMANAPVGDDVYQDDPTVNRLEALAAERTGKEAALFVTSGTQGNLIAILTHCQRGDEMITSQRAHTFRHEVGGAAALGGVHPATIPLQVDGTMRLDNIRAAIRDTDDVHYPTTRLIELENTCGALGGIPLTPEYHRAVRALADEHSLKVHLDGARLWNAAAAQNIDVRELTDPVDSLSFCLSKGLSAPVGSLLCGSQDFINQARRSRKMLGGGMRQAGVLAAAGVIAIEKMTQRLHEDHTNAKRLAVGLSQIPGITLDMNQVQTNMVIFSLDETVPLDTEEIAAILERDHRIKIGRRNFRTFRAVTHYWITPERVDATVSAFRDVLERIREMAE
jgi:threonine aldolase